MGKKGKIGKQRRDKFYHLAKETGYRARSAFKLIQLNRKFEFLQSSRVCIDLCAAPGGWLQVASKSMPISSIVIGVDLVSIKAIPNVITIQGDITTQKCRQDLKKELKTWKADCVLNDGAPNVGSSWVQDAFSQAHLTLAALKLAVEFLCKGGWFITKVFRSKDYQPLMWVFNQLFKKVHATKPQASRNESAEIFVVCQGYKAPDKIDPKLLDWKCIFDDVNQPTQKPASLLSSKKQRRAVGYEDANCSLFKTLPVSEFVKSEKPLDLLSSIHQIKFDDEKYLEHNLTTAEIKQCCEDIKVLGKAEVRSLLNWQAKLHELEFGSDKVSNEEDEKVEEENSEKTVEDMISELQHEEDVDSKRKRRKLFTMKKKARERLQVDGGGGEDAAEDAELFSLNKIKTKKSLEKVDQGEVVDENDSDDDSESDNEDLEDSEDPNDDEDNEDDEDIEDDEGEDGNPLLVKSEVNIDQDARMKQWFSKDSFCGLETVDDEDFEIEALMRKHKKATKIQVTGDKNDKSSKDIPKVKLGTTDQQQCTTNHDEKSIDSESDTEDSESDTEDSDYEVEQEMEDNKNSKQQKQQTQSAPKAAGKSFEVVSQNFEMKNLTPEALALGAQIALSKKRKREIEDESYHRWTFNDDNLPAWFVADESKHYVRNLPVTREEAMEYKDRLREINARPIKKVAEAKARKKRKEMKRMEKARKKAEAICDNDDVTDKEKAQQLRNIYKKAGVGKRKKPEVKYVVAKKGVGKRAKRPAGLKGPYRMVDRRMKKDLRGKENTTKRGIKRGKKR